MTDPTIHDRFDGDDEQLLEAIATHGGRLAVLRQLDAGHDSREMDARDVAFEEGLPADASADSIAEAFADAWQQWYEEAMDGEEQAWWAYYVEHRYGDRADEILEAAA